MRIEIATVQLNWEKKGVEFFFAIFEQAVLQVWAKRQPKNTHYLTVDNHRDSEDKHQ